MDKKEIWNEGAKSGLLLGIFTSVFIFTGLLTASLSEGGVGMRFLSVALSVTFWLIKFFGCLWILRFFMAKFAAACTEASSRQLFSFGTVVALTSAIIVSGVTLLNLTVISPDQMQAAVNATMQSYSALSLGDSDMAILERVMGKLPQIYFFTTLIYCFLFGTVASKIFASTIVRKDEFGDPVENQSENNQSEDNQNE